MRRNSKLLSLAIACAATLCLAGAAQASTISFVTAGGSTDTAGEPVNAHATFTTGSGTITITLDNLQTNEKSVGQNLSDILFQISTGQNSGSVTSSSATARDVHSDHTFADLGSVAAGWGLTTSGAALHLDGLNGTNTPEHTIIGVPNGSSYSNANSSIAGNGPHNPFLANSVTFVLSVPGVTASSTISSATFSFGTTTGDNHVGIPTIPTPEPSSLVLAVFGFAGLAAWSWRRAASTNARRWVGRRSLGAST